jgi:2-hydroxy-6-oxonona-2,4-dienedioate hydrolase
MLDGLLYRGASVRLESRYRRVGGVRMYERYFESQAEAAPVVVLVHGIGVSSRYFLPTAGRLAERCTVYAPDLPGFGLSAPLDVRPTVRRLADAFGTWLDAVGLKVPHAVVANSFGCQLVADFAARRPDRVARLVLVGPTIDRHARSLGRQAARLALDSVREPLGLLALETVDYVQHIRKNGIWCFVEMVRDSAERNLSLVRAPTLVVRGDRDPIVPRTWAEEVAATLPRGRLVEVSGAAHAVNYNAPEALTRLTLDFLLEPAGIELPHAAVPPGSGVRL